MVRDHLSPSYITASRAQLLGKRQVLGIPTNRRCVLLLEARAMLDAWNIVAAMSLTLLGALNMIYHIFSSYHRLGKLPAQNTAITVDCISKTLIITQWPTYHPANDQLDIMLREVVYEARETNCCYENGGRIFILFSLFALEYRLWKDDMAIGTIAL